MSGKPVVLSTSAIGTIIEQYRCGIVVQAGDAIEIRNAIQKIYSMSQDERRNSGLNGKKLYRRDLCMTSLLKGSKK